MAKNLKLNIKNTQIAEAINLSGLKNKLAKKKEEEKSSLINPAKETSKDIKSEGEELPKEEFPRIRARSKSAFAEPSPDALIKENIEEQETSAAANEVTFKEVKKEAPSFSEEVIRLKTSAEIRQEIFKEELKEELDNFPSSPVPSSSVSLKPEASKAKENFSSPLKENNLRPSQNPPLKPPSTPFIKRSESVAKPVERLEKEPYSRSSSPPYSTTFVSRQPFHAPREPAATPYVKLGPTGKHIKDYLKPVAPPPTPLPVKPPVTETHKTHAPLSSKENASDSRSKLSAKPRSENEPPKATNEEEARKGAKSTKFKEFKDIKPTRRQDTTQVKQFDARDRHGLRASDEDQQWRKRRGKQQRVVPEDVTIRPTSLKVRLPISIKDLASEMKLKASQLISRLFLQGMILTLNDLLEDETTVQLLGQEFGCEIIIDTAQEKRIQITDKTIREELLQANPDSLKIRPPVVTFMGHVDHGKTSLIDSIRKSNRAAGEAGAITQHIGAFRCHTAVGDLAILDTPGHEAFSAMRARGADVTDIVVLVVAGDEGLRQQTIEAIQHARAAKVIIVVAINKSDKANFNSENVYRQLAEQDLLPESWGGQTITVNCSAVTGQGVTELLEMLALQAEVLELRADPEMRARGTVLESEMHKGMGAVATILVQNGTLRRGDAVVFGHMWGRIKTMHNEHYQELQEATPSTPVEITGMSGLPEAGQEFIVVKSEREAREIAEARSEGARQSTLLSQQKKKTTVENLMQQVTPTGKKMLNIVLRADVQGSLEALKVALLKIESTKADLNIIFTGVGEVSESDVQLAAASKAIVLGFHTQIESHAEPIVKQLGVKVRLHNIIYHAVDDVKDLMSGLLEKIAQETEKGKAVVKATFKSSHTGIIAGCQVTDGSIHRSNMIRVRRGAEIVWKGTLSSLKRIKEDVREVQKGFECGILLNNFSTVQEGDLLEAYEVTYITQEL